MIRNDVVRARVPSSLKIETTKILETLGLSMTDAINTFLRQIKLRKGLPFNVNIPNPESIQAIEDANKRHTIKAKNVDDLF
ncbi:MAG: type II toxin-antitoxin system antitoxin, RelB/DinJ family [Thiotrichales bacterium]|nr:MAG: type II toxin-antitoxin system antitoxin, RelB/DinJ family [Thiotrichales bacterium]